MQEGKPYILFCAGEDSGDCIGESLVQEVSRKFDVVGAGGNRMQSAGLRSIVDFEQLPVSGFGDVLPKYFNLRKNFRALKKALAHKDCKGLVAIDYPGFNMKLVGLAGKLRKPSLYVAPPQVWAWKPHRARILSRIPLTKLAVFFDFEKTPYEQCGCKVDLLQHPFVKESLLDKKEEDFPKENILLLPGSRERQMRRNIPLFLNVAELLTNETFIFVASRKSLLVKMQNVVSAFFDGSIPPKYQFMAAPENPSDRSRMYRNAKCAVTAPGTASLELALSGIPFVVCMRPDWLTYTLGKRFVKTWSLSLPNIILGQKVFAEFVKNTWNTEDFKEVASVLKNQKNDVEGRIRERLSEGVSVNQLMSEFLAQFV